MALILILRVLAVSILVAGGTHLLLGVNAETLLGAKLPIDALTEPSLDSQNRFYGTSYCLYGILIWTCTRDMPRYRVVFQLLLAMTFVAGLTRIFSIIVNGWPAPAILALSAIELILPPLLFIWEQRSRTLS